MKENKEKEAEEIKEDLIVDVFLSSVFEKYKYTGDDKNEDSERSEKNG